MVEVIWAAGFIEGDGSLSASRGRGYSTLVISAAQKTPAPLNRLSRLWGGAVQPKRQRVTAFGPTGVHVWSIGGLRAFEIAKEIYPYLSEDKQSSFKNALDRFQNLRTMNPNRRASKLDAVKVPEEWLR